MALLFDISLVASPIFSHIEIRERGEEINKKQTGHVR